MTNKRDISGSSAQPELNKRKVTIEEVCPWCARTLENCICESDDLKSDSSNWVQLELPFPKEYGASWSYNNMKKTKNP